MKSKLVPALLAVIAVGVLAIAAVLILDRTGGDGPAAAERPESVDLAGWQAAREDAGSPVYGSMAELERLTRDDLCDNDADDWAIYLSLGGTNIPAERTGVEYVCPDRLEVFDEGQASLQDSADRADRICNMDPAEMTEDEAQFAEAVCID